MVSAGLASSFAPRIGVRPVTAVGMVLTILGLLLFARMPVDGSYATDVLPGMILGSLGMGAIFMPLTLVATTGLKDEDQGLASGLFNTSQQVGGALGLAILSTVAVNHTSAAALANPLTRIAAFVVHGWHYAFAGAGVLVGLSLVVLLALLRKQDVAAIEATARPSRAGCRRDDRAARRRAAKSRAGARRGGAGVRRVGPRREHRRDRAAAGVGHGTVFRRFPTKDDLMYAVIERHVAQMCAIAEEALAADDPGEAFFDFVHRVAELAMSTPGLHQCVVHCGEKPGAPSSRSSAPKSSARAQRAGALRSDLKPDEVGHSSGPRCLRRRLASGGSISTSCSTGCALRVPVADWYVRNAREGEWWEKGPRGRVKDLVDDDEPQVNVNLFVLEPDTGCRCTTGRPTRKASSSSPARRF